MNTNFKNGRMTFDVQLDIDVDTSSKMFLYLQVKQVIKQAIVSGQIEKGIRLPSAREIGKTNVVSLATVERAYRDLRREGIVEKRKGDGYFVSDRVGLN